MEALIRWQKTDELILPRDFFYAAEESDLIIPITEWVLRTACLQNKKWKNEGLPEISVAINLSINNLNARLLDVVEQTLKDTGLNPQYLEIELTESILMKNVENNIQILTALKEIGLKIAIDDFGTGYSSLSYLTRFPIDYLKIDQSFIRDIEKDPNNAAIIVAIIAMAHSLGFKVIAEGVETLEQLSFLTQHGADEIQGYYFSLPLSAQEVVTFLQNEKVS
jgi:EAL domain-containing protein (putative c-di-GMP-specific phosphodiesterase class I)